MSLIRLPNAPDVQLSGIPGTVPGARRRTKEGVVIDSFQGSDGNLYARGYLHETGAVVWFRHVDEPVPPKE